MFRLTLPQSGEGKADEEGGLDSCEAHSNDGLPGTLSAPCVEFILVLGHNF